MLTDFNLCVISRQYPRCKCCALGIPLRCDLNKRPITIEQNAELFTLTYGALVIQLIKDYEDYTEVNKQLEKM